MFRYTDGNINYKIIGHWGGRDACNASFIAVILGSYWPRQLYCHIYFHDPNLGPIKEDLARSPHSGSLIRAQWTINNSGLEKYRGFLKIFSTEYI